MQLLFVLTTDTTSTISKTTPKVPTINSATIANGKNITKTFKEW